MRTILLSTVAAILTLAFFGGCTTTVKAPSGRTMSVGTRVNR
jgi:hypothetical protein